MYNSNVQQPVVMARQSWQEGCEVAGLGPR